MAANKCDIYPIINGEPSALYKDLLDKLNNDRKLVNYIYAAYLQQGVAAQMDNSYSRNTQGEHNATDVMEFLNIDKLIVEQSDEQDFLAMRKSGAVDSKGKVITYTNGKQALEKADIFNNSTLGESWIASVYQHDNEFQIYVERKDSYSVQNAGIVKQQLQAWDIISQAMRAAGIDLDNLVDLKPEIFSPININGMLDWLINTRGTINLGYANLLSINDLKALLILNGSSQLTQRVIQRFGDLDTAASEFFDYLNNNHPFSPSDSSRFSQLTSILSSMSGLDPQSILNQITQNNSTLQSSDISLLIADTIKLLGKDVNSNIITSLNRTNKKITSLSDIAIKAAVNISNQLREAENKKDKQEVLRLKQKLSQMMSSLDGKYYYGNTLELLSNLTTTVSNLLSSIQNPPAYSTTIEKIRDIANKFAQLQDIIDENYDIIEALAEMDSLMINENISNNDKANLQRIAIELKEKLNLIRTNMQELKAPLAVDILSEYLGVSEINGVSIAYIATHASVDTKFFDRLMASTDISAPMVQTIGTIIRRAQQERDKKVKEFGDRIQRASYKLAKAGITDTEWMYTVDGNIISDISWSAYYTAKKNYKEQLKAQGYKGYALDRELLQWEEANTEDRVVDTKSGRTERVPNGLYRLLINPLDSLSPEQLEYYNEVMQIKGELGTAVPEYARNHYLPPQIRMDLYDAWRDAKKNYRGKARLKRIWWIIKDKLADIYTWREDEEFVDKYGYYANGFTKTEAAANRTEKKRIPIFYNYRLKDQSMLDRNFGRALGLMATTSLNYEAMSNIEDTVLFLKNYTEKLGILGESLSGKTPIDIVEASGVTIAQNIIQLSNVSKANGIIEGIIDGQLYGRSAFKRTAVNKIIKTLIGYTSVTSLAVNVKGALTNRIIGKIQTFIEAVGGEFYTLSDWRKAEKMTFNPKRMEARINDLIMGTKTSLDTLLNERFNVQQKLFSQLKDKKFYLSAFNRAVTSGESTILYGLGEYSIHQVNLRAILINEKVLLNGEEVSLIDVFEASEPIDGVSELQIKGGATRLNGSPITEEYLDSIMNIVKLVNQEHHGAMADEDKGTIHRYLLGKLIMNFRQWMIKHYSRRFSSEHIDPLTRKKREGFHRTFCLMLLAGGVEYTGFKILATKLLKGTQFEKNLNKLTKTYSRKDMKLNNDKMRLANVRKALTEWTIALLFWGLDLWIDDDDDDEDKKEKSWGRYQAEGVIDRLKVETIGSTPIGLITQSKQLLNNPIPSVNTYNKLVYPITGLPDLFDTYDTGRFAGQNKYIHKMGYEFLPFIKHIDYFINPENDKRKDRAQ